MMIQQVLSQEERDFFCFFLFLSSGTKSFNRTLRFSANTPAERLPCLCVRQIVVVQSCGSAKYFPSMSSSSSSSSRMNSTVSTLSSSVFLQDRAQGNEVLPCFLSGRECSPSADFHLEMSDPACHGCTSTRHQLRMENPVQRVGWEAS